MLVYLKNNVDAKIHCRMI